MEFIQLALEHKPLNLGQGLPDDLVPDYVINSLREEVPAAWLSTTHSMGWK